MKNIFTSFLIAFLAIYTLNAQVHTVSNFQPAQYTTVQAAIDAANAGDTIYINGSQTLYADFNVTKKLTIIGSGIWPNSRYGWTSKVGTVYVAPTADYSKIIGIIITALSIPSGADNIFVEKSRNENYCSLAGNNITLVGCFLNGYTNGGVGQNLTIRNCFINATLNYLNATTLVFNNIIYNSEIGGSFVTVFNNVFYNPNTTVNLKFDGKCTYTNFSNNLTYAPAADGVIALGSGNNTGTNNLNNVDPQFVNAKWPFDPTADYNLKATSPAKNYGTDGTDIGINGYNYIFPMRGEPNIPQIYEFIIQNPIIPVGGTINFNVKVRKVD